VNNFGINIGIGYESQWADFYVYDYYYSYYSDTVAKAINGISFKLGFVF
jgi:hypothetical protein